jgi:aspartate/methionine/tyrosine aminotransferase
LPPFFGIFISFLDFAMMPGLLSQLPPGPFARLAQLLGDTKPGLAPINLSIGDPSGAVPDFVTQTLMANAAAFGTYPPITGSALWREAAADWLKRRFALPAIDADKNLLPLNGTREGLFLAAFTVTPQMKAGARPIIAMPNPFYQCYAAAALAAGAEPLYVPSTAENGFLPDYAALPRAVLERLAAVYICSPSNPEGALADDRYWRQLFALADTYDFTVFADECYADIYFDAPPVCALPTRFAQTGGFERLLTFHSLSKRSGLPGLRSGMVAGDAGLIARFRGFRNVAGPQVALPILAASAAAWRDEAHVTAGREIYRARMAAAEAVLGDLAGWQRPGGGFFLWLDVGDGEEAALRLWREAGVKVLPGAYMGREISPGESRTNPGFSYIRVALVSDLSTIVAACERMKKTLG